MKRTWTVLAVAGALTMLAGPASAQEGTLGPWQSGQQPTQVVDCDGDGTPETSVVVSIAHAAEGSAAFTRPGIAHIEGSTTKQVAMEITGFLIDAATGENLGELPPPPGVRQAGMGTGSWGHGAERDFTCSFTIPGPFPGTLILVVVSGLQTP